MLLKKQTNTLLAPSIKTAIWTHFFVMSWKLFLKKTPTWRFRASFTYQWLTCLGSGHNFILSHFDSWNDLIDAILCSCFIPGLYAHSYFPQYKGQYFIDGGFSNNQPVVNSTIRVSPFAGPSQICPKDSHPSGWKIYYPEEINLSIANLWRCLVAFSIFKENPQSLYEQGYEDTKDYLESGQILLIHPSPSKIKPKKVRIFGIIITILKLMYSLYKFISSLYKSCSNHLCFVPILLLYVLLLWHLYLVFQYGKMSQWR